MLSWTRKGGPLGVETGDWRGDKVTDGCGAGDRGHVGGVGNGTLFQRKRQQISRVHF